VNLSNSNSNVEVIKNSKSYLIIIKKKIFDENLNSGLKLEIEEEKSYDEFDPDIKVKVEQDESNSIRTLDIEESSVSLNKSTIKVDTSDFLNKKRKKIN
jgi:hypothetical protein